MVLDGPTCRTGEWHFTASAKDSYRSVRGSDAAGGCKAVDSGAVEHYQHDHNKFVSMPVHGGCGFDAETARSSRIGGGGGRREGDVIAFTNKPRCFKEIFANIPL
ncbi:hypothetical protein J6590_016245 [Homalodisca vitripennis]|nr:hypothetical protein J6590_016245 [Homalodisca vitripennis]